MSIKGKKIAFVVGEFPTLSTWVLDQAIYLRQQGAEIEVFSFHPAETAGLSERYPEDLICRTHYLYMPKNKVGRFFAAISKILKLLILNPSGLVRAFDTNRYGKQALSFELLFWAAPFAGKDFDLIHCHFGSIAMEFLEIRHILGLKQKIVTSFYGQDVSKVFRTKPKDYYDELKQVSSAFIVMSENMKQRITEHGFPEAKICVLPVGIEVETHTFQERIHREGEMVQIISVGRFVEKKGFDDLLRALVVVKERLGNVFRCTIVGDGLLREKIHHLAKELKLDDVIEWKGVLPIQKILNLFSEMDFFVQPSKTAADGDME